MAKTSALQNIIISNVIISIGSGLLNVYILLYLMTLGISAPLIGVMGLISGMVGVICAPLAGKGIDKYGTRPHLLIGIITSTISLSILITITTEFLVPLSLIAAFFQGIGNAIISVSTLTMLSMISEESRMEKSFSWFHVASLGGTIVGSMVAAIHDIISPIVGFIESYRILTALVIILVLIGSVFLLRIPNIKTGSSSENANHMSREEKILLFKFIYTQSFVYFGAGFFIYYLPIYLTVKFNMSVGVIGTLNAISTALIGAGMLVGPYFLKYIESVNLIVLTQLLSIPLLVIYPWITSEVVPTVYLGRAFLMNMNGPILSAFSMKIFRKDVRGRVNGVNNAVHGLIYSVGSLVGGILIAVEIELLPIICGVLYLLGVVTFYMEFRHERMMRYISNGIIQINKEVSRRVIQ